MRALATCVPVCLAAVLAVTGCDSNPGRSGDEQPMVAEALAPGSLVVYDDALRSGFVDWSWASHSLSATWPVHSGTRSVAFSPSSWKGVLFENTATVSLSGYSGIDLWIRGASPGRQKLRLVLQRGSTVVASADIGAALAAGYVRYDAWQLAHFDFAKLGAAAAVIDGITVQDSSGITQSTVYVDDVVLTPAATTTTVKPTVSTFSASPGSVSSGTSSTLSWAVTGASSVSIDQGIGAVATTGSLAVRPAVTTTYRLTATNAAGTATSSATVSVSATTTTRPVVSFTASPGSVSNGSTSTLSWSVSGATSVSLDQGIGAVAASGNRNVAPAATTTYTMTATNAAGTTTASATVTVSALGSGWLYTKAGSNKIYVQNGSAETVWVGRGVNIDDVFFCGYNSSLWMTGSGTTLETMVENMISQWKPTFVRLSLSLSSYTKVSWANSGAQYHDPVMSVVQAIGAHPGVYVLLTLRSDSSMNCTLNGEPTCVPTAATDAVYQQLVTDFRDAPYVLFGVSNEPGGNALTDTELRTTMSHAVDVIRAKENALGVPHHIVVVQGNSWTSSLSFYNTSPLPQDNVAYEYHAYPPSATGYTMSNIPVIIGEYGPSGFNENLTVTSSFFTDLEAKQIPSTAWDFDPYSDCAPDVVQVNRSTSVFNTTPFGAQVKAYLLAH